MMVVECSGYHKEIDCEADVPLKFRGPSGRSAAPPLRRLRLRQGLSHRTFQGEDGSISRGTTMDF